MASKPIDISEYEALIGSTAHIFTRMVGHEEEDLRQLLRVKVWQSLVAYDGARDTVGEKRWVFGCLRNYIKDLQKGEIRRRKRERPVEHIEDLRHGTFERVMHTSEEEAFELADAGRFLLPSTVSEIETRIIFGVMEGFTREEIGERLGLTLHAMNKHLGRLREKLADWRPSAAEIAAIQAPALVAA